MFEYPMLSKFGLNCSYKIFLYAVTFDFFIISSKKLLSNLLHSIIRLQTVLLLQFKKLQMSNCNIVYNQLHLYPIHYNNNIIFFDYFFTGSSRSMGRAATSKTHNSQGLCRVLDTHVYITHTHTHTHTNEFTNKL